MKRKLCSLLLCFFFALQPVVAYAAESPAQTALYEEGYAIGQPVYSDGYQTTLQGMSARELYYYGVLSSVEPVDVLTDDLLRLDEPFTWLQAVVMMARLLDLDFDDYTASNGQYNVPLWAQDAFAYFAENCMLPSADYTQTLSQQDLLNFIGLVFGQVGADAVLELELSLVSGGVLTRGDACYLLAQLLDVSTDNGLVRDGLEGVCEEFTVPGSLSLTVTDKQDALWQLSRAIRYAPKKIYMEGPLDVLEFFSDWDFDDREILDADDAAKALMIASPLNAYHLSIYGYMKGEKLVLNLGVQGYDVGLLFDINQLPWMKTYVKDDLSSLYETFISEKILPIQSKYPDDTYQQVRAVAELICRTARYEWSYERYENDEIGCHTIRGYLTRGAIVCDGYADVFKQCMYELDIPCVMVYGTGYGEGHAWNKVWVDGAWYNIDVCWMDTGSSMTQYFLKSDQYFRAHHHVFSDYDTYFYTAEENYR